MSLENRLSEIANKHPQKNVNMVTLAYRHIVKEYGCPENIALDYITYTVSEEKPKHFLLWYVDYALEKKRVVRAMTSRPDIFDPHKFP